MSYLLDTNVVSESTKPRPNPKVVAWLESVPKEESFLSVVSIGEIERGIVRHQQPERAEAIGRWLEDEVMPRFQGNILSLGVSELRTWGRITGDALNQGRPVPLVDALLAATAIVHGLTLVTRNTADLEGLPVKLHNPWG